MRVYDLLENTNTLKKSVTDKIVGMAEQYECDAIVKKPDGVVSYIRLVEPTYTGNLHPFVEIELINKGKGVQVESTRYLENFKMPDIKTVYVDDKNSDDFNKWLSWLEKVIFKKTGGYDE